MSLHQSRQEFLKIVEASKGNPVTEALVGLLKGSAESAKTRLAKEDDPKEIYRQQGRLMEIESLLSVLDK